MGTTLAQFRSYLEQRLSSVGVTTFFGDDMKNRGINESGDRVCNYKKWDFLKHALKTESEANLEYYPYPERFKKNSIYRVTKGTGADEEEYRVVSWDLFREEKENETERKVASQLGNQWFIYPAPTTNGEILSVYGSLKWKKLISDSDEAITPEDFDEAIVKLALASALRKAQQYDKANNEVAEVEGQGGILWRLWEMQMDQKPQGYIGTVQSSRFE